MLRNLTISFINFFECCWAYLFW